MKSFKNFKEQILKEDLGAYPESLDAALCAELATSVGNLLGIDWDKISFDEFAVGLHIEAKEHGDVTLGSPKIAGQIALAHLKEIPNYYTLLVKMEKDAKKK
jgi:hypothetical protein